MSQELSTFTEAFLLSAIWTTTTKSLVVVVEDRDEAQHTEIHFQQVASLKTLVSSIYNVEKDNEIWRFEELDLPHATPEITSESGKFWLQDKFGGDTRSQRSLAPDELRHVVLHSDYVHFELICTNYIISAIKKP